MRNFFIILSVFCFSLVGGALFIEQIYHIQACHLCILQRVIYIIVGLVSGVGFIFPKTSSYILFLIMFIVIGGLAAAGQQSIMQYAPTLVNECGFGDPTLTEKLVNYLGDLWPSLFMVTGFCTQKDWLFLGMSLANWSILCYISIFCIAFIYFKRVK